MIRFFFASLLLLLSIIVFCWCPPTLAHDAFYPHHRDDFESMTRRRELRGTVILGTVVFLSVLGTVVYIAFRKSKEPDDSDRDDAKTLQERLVSAANSAASAAECAINSKGDVGKAAEAALTAYAAASGTTWQSRSPMQSRMESTPYQIRCKIGSDVVTLSINTKVIRIKAEHNASKTGFGSQEVPKSASVVRRIAGKEKEREV